MEQELQPKSPAPFRFLNPYITHESFGNMVSENWRKQEDLVTAIKHFSKKASKWNVTTFKHIDGRKKKLFSKLEVVQLALDQGTTSKLLDVEARLIGKIETTLAQEEILWNQKARQDWSLLGDRNYHNRMEMLKLNRTSQCCGNNWLSKGAVEYFMDVFTKEDHDLPNYNMRGKFEHLTQEEVFDLDKAITREEVKQAVFEMGLSKDTGPDGFNAFFTGIRGRSWGIL